MVKEIRSKYQIVIYFTNDKKFKAAFFIDSKGSVNTNFNPKYYDLHSSKFNDAYNSHTIAIAVDYNGLKTQREALKLIVKDLCKEFSINTEVVKDFNYHLKNVSFSGIVFDSNINSKLENKFNISEFNFFPKSKKETTKKETTKKSISPKK